MFEGALLKVKRAKEHICDLHIAFDGFVETHKYTLSVSQDPDSGTSAIDIDFSDPKPEHFALILGDAIHNLRTALDHAMWELMGHDRGQQHETLYFPTSKGRKAEYEAVCNGLKTPRDDSKKFFIALEAF